MFTILIVIDYYLSCAKCSLTDSHRRMLGDLTSQSSACTCNPPLEPSSNRPPVLLGFSSNNHQIMRHCNGVGDDGEDNNNNDNGDGDIGEYHWVYDVRHCNYDGDDDNNDDNNDDGVGDERRRTKLSADW